MLRATPEANQLWLNTAITLAEMSAHGFCVDTEYVRTKSKEVREDIARLEEQIRLTDEYRVWRSVYGPKTKLTSRSQLKEVMYKHLGYAKYTNARTMKVQMNEAALEYIDTPFAHQYLEVEKLKKALGTYLEGIIPEIRNGKVHPFFSLNNVDSYRSASQSPNVQNIPKRNPVTKKLARRAYIASPGNVICEIDFGQLEVRISECYHKDPVMHAYLLDPKSCMHTDTAMELFSLERGEVSKKGTRDIAKNAFVFAQFYGSTWFNCAPQMWKRLVRDKCTLEGSDKLILDHLREQGITELGDCDPESDPAPYTFGYRCKQVEDSFWNRRFTVYTEWKKQFFNKYLENKGFVMKTGFACTNDLSRRQVLNYPIQGSAFHCLAKSLNLIRAEIRKKRMRSRLVTEIHDALVADCPASEVHDFAKLCERIMTKQVPEQWRWINVPLVVEAEASALDGSWAEMSPLKF